MPSLALVALLASGPLRATAADPGAEHLLAGSVHFREGRFDQALVEFRVADALGAGGDATWYAAAALVKLDRSEEAVEAFAVAEQRAPDARDALLDYYRALACYGARLYLAADLLLDGVGDRSGPKVAAQAAKVREDLSALFKEAPDAASIDWYLARAGAALDTGRPHLARAFYFEAAALSSRLPTPYRLVDAQAGVASATRDIGKAKP